MYFKNATKLALIFGMPKQLRIFFCFIWFFPVIWPRFGHFLHQTPLFFASVRLSWAYSLHFSSPQTRGCGCSRTRWRTCAAEAVCGLRQYKRERTPTTRSASVRYEKTMLNNSLECCQLIYIYVCPIGNVCYWRHHYSACSCRMMLLTTTSVLSAQPPKSSIRVTLSMSMPGMLTHLKVQSS